MTTDLQNLLLQKKFADNLWIDRGLNPSSKSLCNLLQTELDVLIKEILDSLSNSTGSNKISILQNSLTKFNKYDLDTEEKELIVDYFAEIAKLINIDIHKNLNIWLYGFDPDEIPKIKRPVILKTISNNCSNCQASLSIEILKERNNVPAFWQIVQCNNCNEFNLLSIPENIDRFQNLKFFVFETLKKNEHTLENAIQKMKIYRKNNSD